MKDTHTRIPLLRWKFKFKLSHKTQSFKENCFVKTSQGVQKSRNNLMKTNFNFFFTIQPFIISGRVFLLLSLSKMAFR